MEREKAKLRQQILAGENDINTLSGFAASGKGQIPNHTLPPHLQMGTNGYSNGPYGANTQQYDNHDLLTPVNAPGGYSGTPLGKASITSTSSRSMQRFFRRKGGDSVAFDDENGADISDVAADVSFADIAHIRGNGRYNTSSMAQSLDTLPIIPVLGSMSGATSTKNLNNIQYRKYMNQQKKMNLANSARAMSLAGSNQAHLMVSDPRAMSFGGPQDGRTMSFGPQNGRAQSLGGQMNQMPNGPRAMSLNSNIMLRNQGPGPGQGPGQGPMYRRGPGMNMGQMNPNGNPNFGPNPGQMMNSMYNQINVGQAGNRIPGVPHNQQFRGNLPNNRNNSLGGMPGGMPGQHGQSTGYPGQMGQMGQQGGYPGYSQMNPRTQSLTQSGAYPPMGQRAQSLTQGGAYPPIQKKMGVRPIGQQSNDAYQQNPEYQLHHDSLEHLHLRPPQQSSSSNSNTNSKDSLMGVVEEDEEKEELNLNEEVEQQGHNDQSLPLADDTLNEDGANDEDVVYKFENDPNSPQLSRKSTIKKSNSMRVRRLDLFKSSTPATTEEPTADIERNDPSFGLDKIGDRTSKKLAVDENDEEVNQHIASQATKFKALGASSEDKDQFVTAPEFRSPRKKPPPPIDSFEVKNEAFGKKEKIEKSLPDIPSEESAPPSPNILMISQPRSKFAKESYHLHERHASKDSIDSKKRPIRLRSLVANTAFSNFRSPSMSSQSKFELDSRPSSETEQPNLEKTFNKFDEPHVEDFGQPDDLSDRSHTALQNSIEDNRGEKEYKEPFSDEHVLSKTEQYLQHSSTTPDEFVQSTETNLNDLKQPDLMTSFAPPHVEKNYSETESQSSVYSTDTPQEARCADLVSPSSEQHSHNLEPTKIGLSKDDLNKSKAELESIPRLAPNTMLDTIHNDGSAGLLPERLMGQERTLETLEEKNSPVREFANSHGRQLSMSKSRDDPDALNSSEFADHVSHTGSSRATSDTRVDVTPGRTFENRNSIDRSIRLTDGMKTPENLSRRPLRNLPEDCLTPLIQKRTSAISRSNSELKMQGLLPSSGLLKGGELESSHGSVVDQQDSKRKSRTSSISTKSKSFIKRLSRSSSKKAFGEDGSYDEPSPSFGSRVASNSSLKEPRKPLVFTKEELAIMTTNNDLQNELQIVTSELAMSIKRELALEKHLRNGQYGIDASDSQTYEEESTEKASIIADLLEKLNNERRLRFISEEHAILSEHGQTPSALKLDYEKNEIYKQLLAKNDMVNQLQDRLDEIENSGTSDSGQGMLHKYNDLLRENSELRYRLENALASSEHHDASDMSFTHGDSSNEYDQAQIISLRTQRDELREMLTKLTSSQNMELKIAQDRIKILEDKLQKVNMINDKLSRRLDRGSDHGQSNEYSRDAMFTSGQGGKLLGFDIVSPRKKFYDE